MHFTKSIAEDAKTRGEGEEENRAKIKSGIDGIGEIGGLEEASGIGGVVGVGDAKEESVGKDETCGRENFEAQCSSPGHLILTTKALYGRMRLGRYFILSSNSFYCFCLLILFELIFFILHFYYFINFQKFVIIGIFLL